MNKKDSESNDTRNMTIAGILAMLFGTIGLHKFYMKEWKQGILYLVFFWTGVPLILGMLDGARYLRRGIDGDSVRVSKQMNDNTI